jgi:hypothetical protein
MRSLAGSDRVSVGDKPEEMLAGGGEGELSAAAVGGELWAWKYRPPNRPVSSTNNRYPRHHDRRPAAVNRR